MFNLLHRLALGCTLGLMIAGCSDNNSEAPVSPKTGQHGSLSTGVVYSPEPPPAKEPELSPIYFWPTHSDSSDPIDLVPEQFRLTKNYYVILDASGSMYNDGCTSDVPKEVTAKKALKTFVNSINPDDNLGLLVFDEKGTSERQPLSTINTASIEQVLQTVKSGGGTPLGHALKIAKDKLQHQALKQQGYGEYNLIVVTDGEASDSAYLEEVVTDIAMTTPITIRTIGFCIGDKHTLNQPNMTQYQSADNYEQLVSGLDKVLAESETFDLSVFETQE